MNALIKAIRQFAGYRLSEYSFKIMDIGIDLASAVMGEPPIPPMTDIEADLNTAALMSMFEAHSEHPYPHCDGQGAVITADNDAFFCPACKGTQIDPAYIAAPIEL